MCMLMTRFKDVMPKGTLPHNLKLERPMPPTLQEVGNQEEWCSDAS